MIQFDRNHWELLLRAAKKVTQTQKRARHSKWFLNCYFKERETWAQEIQIWCNIMWSGFLENTENMYSWNTLHEQFRLKGLMLSLSFFSITCIISVSAQINWRKLTGKYQSSCCTSLKLQRARWGESRSSFLAFITNTRGSFQFQREVVVLVSSYVSYFEFERQNMVMHEGFPQWWPELVFLCGASRGWEDDAPPGARHVDGAAQLQYPRDRFFIPQYTSLFISRLSQRLLVEIPSPTEP